MQIHLQYNIYFNLAYSVFWLLHMSNYHSTPRYLCLFLQQHQRKSLALTVLSFCQARCPHKKAVTGLEIICCLHPPKPTTVQSLEQIMEAMMTPCGSPHPSSQMPGSPTHGLKPPDFFFFLALSQHLSPVCLAPRLRCIPRWGKWVGVYQVPVGGSNREAASLQV